MRSVALTGRAGAGKDTVAAILGEMYGHVRVAFADPLKRMALGINPVISWDGIHNRPVYLAEMVTGWGWDPVKRNFPEVRRFLQRLGSEGVRDVIGDNTWIRLADQAVGEITASGRPVVVTDARFPNEVAWARRCDMFVVWVERPDVADGAHASESAVTMLDADAVLFNDGTVDDLRERTGVLMRHEGADTVCTCLMPESNFCTRCERVR